MNSAVDEPRTGRAVSGFSLLITSEREHGRKLALRSAPAMIVGRALDADVPLNDHLTSRRHAQISVHGEQVVVEDLESTNGTFVNSQKIRRAVIRAGDRVLIGVTTLELVADNLSITLPGGHATRPGATQPAPASPARSTAPTTMVETAKSISGSVKEIPIPDLLQLLHHMRKSGILLIRNGQDTGKLYLCEGRIRGATINGSCAVEPKRTFYRLLRWQKGTFDLRPPEEEPVREDIADLTESLLLEAAWQHDELMQLESQLPPLDSRLALATPLPGPLRDLSQNEMDICQLVLEHQVLLSVIDRFVGTDFDAYKDLVSLIERKYIVVN